METLEVVQASELLIGLWIRGLAPAECLRIVSDWLERLTADGGEANDNDIAGLEAAKGRAAALLLATCDTCPAMCPRNPNISRREPPRPSAHRASPRGRRR
jgi:hypothetical protein